MEPTTNLEGLPLVWQYVGSTIVLIVTSGIAIYGWVKKNNPFEGAKKAEATLVLSPEHGAIATLTQATLRLAEAQESANRKTERLIGRLGDIYEEQERTNRILKDLI